MLIFAEPTATDPRHTSNTHMTNLILFLTPAAVGITFIIIHKLTQA